MKHEKILDLPNGIVAGLLESVLTERNIPHAIRTMHDTAYDGLYQAFMGWGWVEAPASERETILEIYADIVRSRGEGGTVGEETESRGAAPVPEEPTGEKRENGRLGLFLIAAFFVLLGLAVLLGALVGPRVRKTRDHGVPESRRNDSVLTPHQMPGKRQATEKVAGRHLVRGASPHDRHESLLPSRAWDRENGHGLQESARA